MCKTLVPLHRASVNEVEVPTWDLNTNFFFVLDIALHNSSISFWMFNGKSKVTFLPRGLISKGLEERYSKSTFVWISGSSLMVLSSDFLPPLMFIRYCYWGNFIDWWCWMTSWLDPWIRFSLISYSSSLKEFAFIDYASFCLLKLYGVSVIPDCFDSSLSCAWEKDYLN